MTIHIVMFSPTVAGAGGADIAAGSSAGGDGTDTAAVSASSRCGSTSAAAVVSAIIMSDDLGFTYWYSRLTKYARANTGSSLVVVLSNQDAAVRLEATLISDLLVSRVQYLL